MAIKFIFNDVWKASYYIEATDSGGNKTSDQTGIRNVISGPRHLQWDQTGTDARRIAYVDKDGALSADTMVWLDADGHTSRNMTVYAWSAYPGTTATIQNYASFSETLVGYDSADFVYEFTDAGSRQAYGLGFNTAGYAKRVNKIAFGTALSIPYVASIIRSPISIHQEVKHFDQYYKVDEQFSITFEAVTDTQVNTLQEKWRINREPFFMYDSTGVVLKEKLLYVFCPSRPAVKTFDDFHSVALQGFIMRTY